MSRTMSRTMSRGAFLKASAAAAGGLVLASCGSDSSSADGDSLNVLWASGNASEAIENVLPELQQALRLKLKVDTMPYDAQKQKAFAEFASNSSHYDIIMVDAPWGPALCSKLVPMGRYLADTRVAGSQLELDDFIARVFYDTCVFDQSATQRQYPDNSSVDLSGIQASSFDIYGLPMHANALTMFYRSDLFDDAGEQAAYRAKTGKDLVVPATWDDFVTVAEFFTRPSERLWGTTLMAGVGDWATDDFKTLLGSFGGNGQMISDDFALDFAGPKGVEALTFYQDLINRYKVTPPGTTAASWDTTASTFGSGLTAMTMNYFPVRLNPNVKGGLRYAIVPGREDHAPHMGTSMLSVNKFSKNQEKAVRAVIWLTSRSVQERMVRDGLHPTRTSVFESVGSDPFYRVLGESLAVGVGRPRLTNYEAVSEVIAAAVNRAANGADVEAQLDQAAQETRGLLQQAGYVS
jgi:multiple sugar transport system substrate-binding protein